MRIFSHEPVGKFVYITHTDYYIPSYDEVAERGLKTATSKAAEDLIDLLRCTSYTQLSMDDFCKIRDLIRHEGFDEYSAFYVYKYLEHIVKHTGGTPISGNDEFLNSFEPWASECNYKWGKEVEDK